MKTPFRRKADKAVAFVALFCTVAQPTYALNLVTEPLFLANRIAPKVMIALSKDQQLYKKAYNDYSDLDGDGDPETTYKHSITYYGYFDPIKCYDYTNARFEPTGITTSTVTTKNPDGTSTTSPAPAYCDAANNKTSGRWSGNFLNWASMTRMDAIRKILYGGMRIPTSGGAEQSTITVLERAFVPPDAHSWSKYYNGADVSKLTPFTTLTTPYQQNMRSSSNVTIQKISQDLTVAFTAGSPSLTGATPPFAVGDQVRMQMQSNANRYMIGAITAVAARSITLRIAPEGVAGEGNSEDDWTLINMSSTGISLCNTTPGASTLTSQTNTNPPLIRVAKGNFSLWNANERWQCQWQGEQNQDNANQSGRSEIYASARNPVQGTHGLGSGTAGGRDGTIGATGQFQARVRACVSEALRGTENCKQYGANLKPVGLLQTNADAVEFGLITGSYAKNISGGVIRKAVGSFNNEIDAGTGIFVTKVDGIVKTLNSMRIYGYNYADGTYLGAAGDNCGFQLTDITENNCTSWGNPMSEIFYEALRYFGAKPAIGGAPATAPTGSYAYTNTGSKDNTLGLPQVTSWTPPMNQANVCSKLNVLAFNASVSSDDEDLGAVVASDINGGSTTIRELTNAVGKLEGINGGTYFIGKRLGDASSSTGFELCTPKQIANFGDASGICPEGPTVRGSYLLSGLGYHARTKRVRTDLTSIDADALKVRAYGIQLATNTPQLVIPVPGSATGQKVVINPIYRFRNTAPFGGGSLVDLKYVRTSTSATLGTGKVYLNWEDSEQGGDYDQDMWGILEWEITPTTIKITTNAIAESTNTQQGFGYVISGTTADGPHFHSGIEGFNFTDTVTVTYPNPNNVNQTLTTNGCNNCQATDVSGTNQRGPTSVTYTLSAAASSVGTLKDPLWYLAKYGGFDDLNRNGQIDSNEWDRFNNDTGALGADGIPDTYFLVTNPLGLERALAKALEDIGKQGSGTALASNSTSIRSGTAIYSARFQTADWFGQFAAIPVNTDGTVGTQAWEASEKVPAHNNRLILTYRNDTSGRKGVPFRWPANLPTLAASDIGQNLVDALNLAPGNAAKDNRGKDRLNYLRGDTSLEGTLSGSFRIRKGKLGDIVNSTPAFVPSIPSDNIADPTYVEFQKGFKDGHRPAMVYVAANDGMLHGFNAGVGASAPNGGVERIAYVPSKTFSQLNQLTSPTYVHRYFVDGSPTVADAKLKDNKWHTVLVASLGGGGRGIYALDVTEPLDAVPDAAGEVAAATKVMWEFNVEDDVPAAGSKHGLGYSLGPPVIRRVSDPSTGVQRWAAIVSGGYNNTEAIPGLAETGDGNAYLYILFLDGPSDNSNPDGRLRWKEGTDYIRLSTTGSVATPNGLAPPFVSDPNADGVADYIYAGDLRGNFWKFDITAANATTWNDSKNKVVLFTTPTGQPITAAAKGVFHPKGEGFIMLFGTGKYLELTDPSTTTTQSFYGIWDKNDKPNNIATQTVVKDINKQLLKQVINTETPSGSTTPFRYITNAGGVLGPDWATQLGWYMDLPAAGERSVFEPLVASRRLIFTTLVPSGSPCDFGGTSFIMVVNPATGGEFTNAVLDVNGDGILNTTDKVSGHFASGFQSTVGIVATPRMLLGGGGATGSESSLLFGDNTGRVSGSGVQLARLLFSGLGGEIPPLPLLGAGRDSGRVSWREVIKK